MDDGEFYSSITKWKTGTDVINTQNCFAVNLGFRGEIPLPTISLQIDIRQQLKHYEFEKSFNCFIVFVGGRYVEDMKIIVDIVENISEQLHGMKPSAMFVMGRFNSFEISNFSSQGQELIKVSKRLQTLHNVFSKIVLFI